MTGPNIKPFNVMILAAGLGQRMRPLTDEFPKACVEVFGKPLIGHTLDFLAALEPEKIVINLHYKPETLTSFLADHPLKKRIIFSDETDELLGTGGGVKKALAHFSGKPFMVTNCDAFFTPASPNPYVALAKEYRGEGALLLVEERAKAKGFDGPGDFFMGADGVLSRRGKSRGAPLVFTGLQILDPGLFEGVDDDIFSLNKIYDKALERGVLRGEKTSATWFHIGTPDAVGEAEKTLSKKGPA
jgi:N-acetyl-alpha-D-muramate 1-phosphate uridylyltransferase